METQEVKRHEAQPEDASSGQARQVSQADGAQEAAGRPDRVATELEHVEYIWNAYDFLSPAAIDFAVNISGVPGRRTDRPFTYCDLGCGNAVSLNLLAACFPDSAFYGVDLSAQHIANGRALAEAAGATNLTLVEGAFADLAERDPPQFDFIVAHGVLSWVNADAQKEILAFVERFLAPEGVLLITYNAAPGWARHVPVRELLGSLADTREGALDQRLRYAREALGHLSKLNLPYFSKTPDAAELIDMLREKDLRYVAHEYLSDCWRPLHFSEVNDMFEGAGLRFCGTPDHQRRLQGASLREVLKAVFPGAEHSPWPSAADENRTSLLLCERFRRDIFCRPELLERRQAEPQIDAWAPMANMRAALNSVGQRGGGHAADPKILAACARGEADLSALRKISDFAELGPEFDARLSRLLADGALQMFRRPVAAPAAVDRSGEARYRLTNPFNRAGLEARRFKDDKIPLAAAPLGGPVELPTLPALFTFGADSMPLSEIPAWALSELRRVGAYHQGAPISETLVKAEFEAYLASWLPICVTLDILEPQEG
ncbi:MAG: methyltransferase [Pseudomonadota bacterium]